MNNKGFTLVELIAVIVILTIITALAVPEISGSVERSKARQKAEKTKNIEYAVEIYLSDHKSYRKNFYNHDCFIYTSTLKNNQYLMKEDVSNYYVFYDSTNGIYTSNDKSGKDYCQ